MSAAGEWTMVLSSLLSSFCSPSGKCWCARLTHKCTLEVNKTKAKLTHKHTHAHIQTWKRNAIVWMENMDPIFVLPVGACSECVGVFAHVPRASLRAEQITPIPSYTDKMSRRRKRLQQVHSGPNEQVAARVPDKGGGSVHTNASNTWISWYHSGLVDSAGCFPRIKLPISDITMSPS